MDVPEVYFDFVMDYAPYVYVIPGVGVDQTWGKAAFAAGFAIDFLFEAYFNPQFDSRTDQIEAKIVELANWILTQQCTNPDKQAYGGFKSTENSTYYYTADACRTIPALLKAYELTSNPAFINGAVLAGNTFLFNMQMKPSQLGVHDRYYGGFARAVTDSDAWLPEIDSECLFVLVALDMLRESDPANTSSYDCIISDAVAFIRSGLEGCFDHFSPKPSGDGNWHRVDQAEAVIYDDTLAYALLGLYSYEGWTCSVQKIYSALNSIGSSQLYPAYNSAICLAGYLDASSRAVACDYYDAVTAGILANIRRDHDKPAYEFSTQIILELAEKFMFWGVKHADYSYVENKQAMATVCWLGQLLLGYEVPMTRFTQVLRGRGENLTLHPIVESGERVRYGSGVDIKAFVVPAKAEELLLEPGYVANDYLILFLFAPIRCHDKISRKGEGYEILSTQDYNIKGEFAYRKAICRRIAC